MKQIVRCVVDRGGKVRLVDVPAPICGSKEILVANEYSLISIGTEIKMAQMDTSGAIKTTLKDEKLKNTVFNLFKTMKLTDFLRVVKEELFKGYPMGYSGAGKVTEIGSEVIGANVGDRVAYGGSGHAEIVKVPQNLFVTLPENVDSSEGAFVTLGSIALQGIRQSRLEYGEFVVVYGLGLVGLLTVQILHAYGFKIIGIDIDDQKIESAYKFGADICYNVAKENKSVVTEKVVDYTNGYGTDGVIICAANVKESGIINHSFELARKRGRVVIVGNVGMSLERKEFYRKELDLTISCSYGPGRYDPEYEKKGRDYPYGFVRWTEKRNMEEFVHLISKGKISVKPFITDEVSVNLSEEVYEKIQKDTNYNPVGILLRYDSHQEARDFTAHITSIQPTKIHKDQLNIALIGCGNFSRTTIMPNLQRNSHFNFYALSDNKGHILKQFGEQYKLASITTDYTKLLEDDTLDVIYIATRHNTHQKISIEALQAGKAVICEKPMAMNYEELEELIHVIKKTGKSYHVGYNRRYTDFSKKVRKIINNEKAMVKISINTKKINKDSWLIDPVLGGGRIIGEACHFFDLINFFIKSTPISVYTATLNDSSTNVITNNNFVTTITYKNGSIGQIIYSDLGNSSYPKERIEVHSNNHIIELIDFKEMYTYGANKFRSKLNRIDKGHASQYEEIAKNIMGKSSACIPSLEEYYYAALLPLKAIDSIRLNEVMKL